MARICLKLVLVFVAFGLAGCGAVSPVSDDTSWRDEPGCQSQADCEDGLFCNGREICSDARCIQNPSVDPCEPGRCDEVEDSCIECDRDADCQDNLFCNGREVCNSGRCLANTSNLPCPGRQCDEQQDRCEPIDPGCRDANDCDDGLWCNGSELCDDGICIAGARPCRRLSNCNDGLRECLDDTVAPNAEDSPAVFARGIYTGMVQCDSQIRVDQTIVQNVVGQTTPYNEEFGPNGLPVVNGQEIFVGLMNTHVLPGPLAGAMITISAIDASPSGLTWLGEIEISDQSSAVFGESSNKYVAAEDGSITYHSSLSLVGFDGATYTATQTCSGTLNRP